MNSSFLSIIPKKASKNLLHFARLAGLLAFSISLLFVYQSSFAGEIDDINAAIKAKGARWVAGETSVSRLSPEERKRLLSNGPLSLARQGGATSQTTGNAVSVRAQAAAALPAAYDLRNINGHSYVTPVREQGAAGTCMEFAATGTLESRVLQARNTPDVDLDLSEQIMISCGPEERCNNQQCGIKDFLLYIGLPSEACLPYVGDAAVCGQACANWRETAYRITGYHTVDYYDIAPRDQWVELIKEALVTYGALYSGLLVYDDFANYKSGIYTHVSGTVGQTHGVVIVGYDDQQQCFIAKNSWGTGWGEAGFFRIAYSELTTGDTYFGGASVAYEGIILPEPSFTISAPALNFGTLTAPDDTSKSISLTLTNNGSALLTNLFLSVDNGHFSVSPTTVASIDQNAAAQVTVTYIPSGDNKGSAHTGTLTITTGSLTRTVSLTGTTRTRPATPTNTSPTDGQKDLSLTPALTASAFASNDGAGHEGTCWTIEDRIGTVVYKTSVNGSAFDTTNKTSLKVPSGVLSPAQTYRWYVIYRDARLLTSNPSAATSFSTASNPAPAPDPEPTPTPGGNTGTSSSDGGGGGGGGCFIATAVYGADSWQVKVLKAFRDRWLLTNKLGRALTRLYYRSSPTLAGMISRNPAWKRITEYILTPLVYALIHPILTATFFVLALAGFFTVRKWRQTASR